MGSLIGAVWGFFDWGIAGVIFAWLYNKINKLISLRATTAAAIEASLASDSSDRLVITTGVFPPSTTPAAHAPIK